MITRITAQSSLLLGLALMGSSGALAGENISLSYDKKGSSVVTVDPSAGILDLSGHTVARRMVRADYCGDGAAVEKIEPEEIDVAFDSGTGTGTEKIEPEEIDVAFDSGTGTGTEKIEPEEIDVACDGSAVEKIEPEEIDLRAYFGGDSTAAAKAEDAFFVRCDRSTMSGISEDELDFGRAGSVTLQVSPIAVYMPDQRFTGFTLDASGRAIYGEAVGTLVLMPVDGTLTPAIGDDGARTGEVELNMGYEVVDIFIDDVDFHPETLIVAPTITFPRGTHHYSNITLKRG